MFLINDVKSWISKQRAKLSGYFYPDIDKVYPRMRNLPEIFLVSYENVDPGS